MKKVILIVCFFLFYTFNLFSVEPKLQMVLKGLDSPWSLTFINYNKVLITEKAGNLKLVDFNNKKIKEIKHNLDILEDGQGGLLEVLYHNEEVFVSYSENLKKGKTSSVIGIDRVFKRPLNPWLSIDSGKNNPEKVFDLAWEKISHLEWLSTFKK